MKVAASHALATVIPTGRARARVRDPGVFNRDVAPRVAAAVAEAAERDGVARKLARVTASPAGGAPGAPYS